MMRSTLEFVALALALALLSSSVGVTSIASTDLAMPSLAPLPIGSTPLDRHSNRTSFLFIFAGDNLPASAVVRAATATLVDGDSVTARYVPVADTPMLALAT